MISTRQRPSKRDTFLVWAEELSKLSTCERAQVGAIFYRDGRAIVSGYNGAPRKMPHCIDPGVGCLVVKDHCVRSLHAEQNAIIQAAYDGISVQGCEAVLTHRPCIRCALMMVQAGVVGVYWARDYDTDGARKDVIELFDRAGVRWSFRDKENGQWVTT